MRTQLTCRDVQAIIAEQSASLFDVHQFQHACHIVTPYFLPDNSEIVVEVEAGLDGSFRISDGGIAADQLYLHGVVDHVAAKQCKKAAARFGFDYKNGEIFRRVEPFDLAKGIVRLCTIVGDASSYRSASATGTRSTSQRFEFEVERFLATNRRQYERDVTIKGKSGFPYNVDFRIKDVNSPTQLQLALFVLSAEPDSKSAENAGYRIFTASQDIKAVETTKIEIVTIFDDVSHPGLASSNYASPLKLESAGIDRILFWSDQGSVATLLLAA